MPEKTIFYKVQWLFVFMGFEGFEENCNDWFWFYEKKETVDPRTPFCKYALWNKMQE